jgi:class 3 adenylate cyclase
LTAVAASVILAPTLEPPATARWSSYLPDLVLDELSRAPRREGARSFEAVVLFVDIKGFTTLSEAFARQGRRGSERLARAVGDFFDPLVDLARGYGLVMEFSGDAMTVLFPHAPGRWRTAAARAARCALAMHAAAARTHVHPDAPLAVKAGLARGPLLARIVGDAGKRLVSVVTGEPLRAAVGAEKLAQTGETIVAPDLVFEDILAGRSAAGGHCALASVARAAGGRPHARQSPDLPDAAAHAVRFLPPPIAARLRAGHVGLLGEHREATALFAYAPGFGGGDVAAQVDTYFSSALEIVDRYGGWFVQADTDDNGLRSLVAFGAFVQHEDDADRALRCALALRELADGAIGIATGRVFCGPLGAHARHDCGILGDTVNVAARLASLAEPGETLVTDATSARTRRRFALGARRTITPRG